MSKLSSKTTSNTICVKIHNTLGYYSFRWEKDKLQVFYKALWMNVKRTTQKNTYGDFIFQITSWGFECG